MHPAARQRSKKWQRKNAGTDRFQKEMIFQLTLWEVKDEKGLESVEGKE